MKIGSPMFFVVMILILVGLIGLFLFLRNKRSEDDKRLAGARQRARLRERMTRSAPF